MSALVESSDLARGAVETKTEFEAEVLASIEWGSEEQDPEDPYEKAGLPPVSVCDENGDTMLLRDADGLLLSRNVAADVLAKREIFQARDDDIVLATYPKCGTHWAWEIVSMLKQGSHSLLQDNLTHVDFFPLDMLNALPSPRVLGTHMPFSYVPQDFLSRDCKIIWVVRHPGDVAVSFYEFTKRILPFQYSGRFDGFLGLYLDGNVAYGSWFDYTLQWMQAMESRRNILMVRFEDLLSNFKAEVRRMAKFLDIEVTEALLEAIQRETSFQNMAENKVDYTVPFTKNGAGSLFRNGKSNEWRKEFSLDQADQLEAAYMAVLSKYADKLKYTFH